MKKIIYFWFPPILWMVIIFFLSSRTKISLSPEYLINFLIFKTLHMIEYAILYLLFFRAFLSHSKNGLPLSTSLLVPILFSVIFAASDELHQTFVYSRQGTVRDVIIDTVGIILMFIFVKNNLKFFKKLFLWKI